LLVINILIKCGTITIYQYNIKCPPAAVNILQMSSRSPFIAISSIQRNTLCCKIIVSGRRLNFMLVLNETEYRRSFRLFFVRGSCVVVLAIGPTIWNFGLNWVRDRPKSWWDNIYKYRVIRSNKRMVRIEGWAPHDFRVYICTKNTSDRAGGCSFPKRHTCIYTK